jgi:hypothetical protein
VCVCVFGFLQGILSNKKTEMLQSRTAGLGAEESFGLGDGPDHSTWLLVAGSSTGGVMGQGK